MSYYSLFLLVLYAVTVSAVFSTRFVKGNSGNLLAIFAALVSFNLAAMRPSDFPDLDTYQLMYEFASAGSFDDPLYWAAHGEPGFKILTYALSSLGVTFDGFLFFMAWLSFFLLMALSARTNVPFAYLWFTYFSCYFITRDLGVIRLAIASHLIVLFFIERSLLRQGLILGFATITFQAFAFIAVIAKILSKYRVDFFSIAALFVVSYVLGSVITFDKVIAIIPENQAASYAGTDQVMAAGKSMILPVLRNLVFAFLIYFLLREQRPNKQIRIILWSVFLSAAVYILSSGILVVAQRFSAYFGAAVPLALAFLMQQKPFKNERFFLIVLVCIMNFSSLFYYNDFVWQY